MHLGPIEITTDLIIGTMMDEKGDIEARSRSGTDIFPTNCPNDIFNIWLFYMLLFGDITCQTSDRR